MKHDLIISVSLNGSKRSSKIMHNTRPLIIPRTIQYVTPELTNNSPVTMIMFFNDTTAFFFSFSVNFPPKAATDTSRQWKPHKYQLVLTKSLGEVIRDQNVARKCNISKEHCLQAPGITHNLSKIPNKNLSESDRSSETLNEPTISKQNYLK